MGMSLCKDQADTRPATRKLTLWGDYINPETKCILTVLNMHHIDYDFRLIDTMREEHKLSEEFNNVSPIQEIPCITEGSYKIISGPCQFMFYLCNTRSIVKDSLYPKDCERMINRHIAWYQNKLRPKTQKLNKMLQR